MVYLWGHALSSPAILILAPATPHRRAIRVGPANPLPEPGRPGRRRQLSLRRRARADRSAASYACPLRVPRPNLGHARPSPSAAERMVLGAAARDFQKCLRGPVPRSLPAVLAPRRPQLAFAGPPLQPNSSPRHSPVPPTSRV